MDLFCFSLHNNELVGFLQTFFSSKKKKYASLIFFQVCFLFFTFNIICQISVRKAMNVSDKVEL